LAGVAAEVINPFGLLVVGVLGVLCVTSEYSSHLVLATVTAVPRRWPVVVGKALALVPAALIAAVLALGVGIGVAYAVLRDEGVDPVPWSDINRYHSLAVLLYVVTMALFGLAIGLLVRSSPGAVATLVAISFALPLIGQLVFGLDELAATPDGWEGVAIRIYDVLPSVAGGRFLAWDETTASAGLNLAPWPAFGVLWLWVLVFALPGWVRLVRGDV